MRRKRCQRIEESNRTFLDLTTDSNCHRPTTSLDTVSGNLVLRAPLPLLLSTVALPSYSLLFSLSLSLFPICARVVYPCTHIPSAQHRHPRVTTTGTLSLTAPPHRYFFFGQLPLALDTL